MHNPQLFIDWTLYLNRYFTWYELTQSRKVKYAASRKVKYAAMKLSRQVS